MSHLTSGVPVGVNAVFQCVPCRNLEVCYMDLYGTNGHIMAHQIMNSLKVWMKDGA